MISGRREAASLRTLSLVSCFAALLAAPAPLRAQVPFEILTNTVGAEQRQVLTKPDALFGGVVASDGRLIVATGDAGVIHTFIQTPDGFVDTHPLYEASPAAGRALAMHNGRAIVGFEYGAGIFRYTDDGWVLERYILGADSRFGSEVDITEGYAIVAGDHSFVIVRREGSDWIDDADIERQQPFPILPFPLSRVDPVSISHNRALVARREPITGPGTWHRILLYERDATGWSMTELGPAPEANIGDLDLDGTLGIVEIIRNDPGAGARMFSDRDTYPGVFSGGSSYGMFSVDGERVAAGLATISTAQQSGFTVYTRTREVLLTAGLRPPVAAGGIALSGELLVVGLPSFAGPGLPASEGPGRIAIFNVPLGPVATPSPDGTRSPPAPQIVDAQLNVWTFGSNFTTFRNGVYAGGRGTQYLWYQNVLYVLGFDDQWWRWTGDSWYPHGPTDPAGGGGLTPSPSGTRTPPAPQIVDQEMAIWTLGSNLETLRNGAHAGGGLGAQYLFYQNVIYVLGLDDQWWRWTGAGWHPHGPTDPSSGGGGGGGGGPTPSPSGTRGSSITDNDLAVWTIGPGFQTLRNGVHSGFGLGSQYLWQQGILYVLGTDANWYMWTGSGWTFFGLDPAS